MDVKQQHYEQTRTVSGIVNSLLREFSVITEYHVLQEGLPRRLADLLNCRCVLIYMRLGETLQFTSGSFEDIPGWSASLLAVAHINPISLESQGPEARAWNLRQVVCDPEDVPTLLVAPLIYRHRSIGVLVAQRGEEEGSYPTHWHADDLEVLEATAGIVALLLENTRLFERDRERIHELSLLNSISSQMNYSLHELERMRRVVLQRSKEIASTDVCAFLEPDTEGPAWITPQLQNLLFQHFKEQHSLLPLVIERPGDGNPRTGEYIQQLPLAIRTFFAVPLLSERTQGKRYSLFWQRNARMDREVLYDARVLGIIVGGYHRNHKLFREELVLLQVLSSQTSVMLENMHLLTEVIEARNQARKLLHQVLDDQRFKELILESVPSGLITTDQKGSITTFNRAAEDILGYAPHEVLGHPLEQVLHLHTAPALQQRWEIISSQAACAGRSGTRNLHGEELCNGILPGTNREGHRLVLDLSFLPLCDGHAEPIGMLVTFSDVTSIRRLEEEKRRLDRLASLGEMAANVAHEVRNPLASIKTSMQMLIDDLKNSQFTEQGDEDPVLYAQESGMVVLKEVERLDTLVHDLLLFARPRQLHRLKCDMSAVSDHVLLLLQPQCARANVMVQRVYSPLPPFYADLGQVEQILFNLYMNAIQAMPDGGILTVSCRTLSAEQAISDVERASTSVMRNVTVSIQSYHEGFENLAEQWLEIAVNDTGEGIPQKQLERIFQPFFTTKAHGIGLGLAITRRLVEDHGGYILVEGQVGLGAIIAVRLPIIPPAFVQHTEDELGEEEGGEA